MSPTSRTPFHSPSYESARKISPWPAKHSLDLTDRMIVWYSGLWAEPVRVSLVGSVEGPRFDLDLRDSISAQVDETVPVYSILKYKYTLSYIYIIAAFYADATTARRGRGPLLSSPPGSACRG